MNIGELTKNANGFYTGKIVTLAEIGRAHV